jgi:hypothetical protein
MRRISVVLAIAFAVVLAACGPKSSTARSSTPRRDPSIMDTTELRGGNFATVYDAVSALHADWLLPRGGPGTGGRAPALGVWIEGQQRANPADFLKTIRPVDIRQLRRLTISEALQTYNWPWGGLVVTLR